jgi:mono/diheme cytochrome c family protein
MTGRWSDCNWGLKGKRSGNEIRTGGLRERFGSSTSGAEAPIHSPKAIAAPESVCENLSAATSGLDHFPLAPTAYAMGFNRSPLRGSHSPGLFPRWARNRVVMYTPKQCLASLPNLPATVLAARGKSVLFRRILGISAQAVLLLIAMSALPARNLLAQNPSYEPDPHWHAPAKAAHRANPLSESRELSAGGRKLFLRECAECHGSEGSGIREKHSADLRAPVVQFLSDGALFWKITNGDPRRGMPSFSRLPEKQRWQLVLFLRTLRADPGVSPSK